MSIEGIVTEYECACALKQMNNNKSPGSDGLTTEFFKIFWNDIKQFYVKSLNYSFETGNLTTLQKQGIISLLPKKDKDLCNLNNWRPLTLLNTDYKIATKAIANRIKKYLPNIINCSQTGFIKGRYIGENIRLVQETIEKLDDENMPGLLFFADFEKAFDSVSHKYIIECLKTFNFGPDIIKWVKCFYQGANSCVQNAGVMSDFFSVSRGVRQGCPLSPYLFILCIEILSSTLNKDQDITVIKINGREFKCTMFADDATFAMDGSLKSFKALIQILDDFKLISGLKLNVNKTIILRVGSLRYTDIQHLKNIRFVWTSDSAKTLGIIFSTDKHKLIENNWIPKLNDFVNCLKRWNHRKLSLMGKVTVVKTFALPKLIYPLTVLNTPPVDILKQIKSEIFKFIWESKPDKIKRSTIMQDYKNGGLRMINIDYFIWALKAGWVKRIFDDSNKGIWKEFYIEKLNAFGGKVILESTLNTEDCSQIAKNNLFLRDVLTAWCKINENGSTKTVTKEIIWNNSQIKCNNNILFYRDWYDKGIKLTEHIYDFRTRQFYTVNQLKDLYGISENDFLKYYNIVSNIPKAWKNKLKTENHNILTEKINKALNAVTQQKGSVNKTLYNLQFKNATVNNIKAEEKWAKEFPQQELNWPQFYLMSFNCTIDVKLRNFQYKYLMRILPNNKYLFKCKLTPSVLCDFCSMQEETNFHLFWHCWYIQALWSKIQEILTFNNIDIQLNYFNISFGTSFKNKIKN